MIEKLETFVQAVKSIDKPAVDLVITGDSWTEKSLAIFSERLEGSGINEKIDLKNKIHQPDIFAATQRAARWGMSSLERYDPLPGVPIEPDAYDEYLAHDEL